MTLNDDNVAKSFDILATSLSVLHNYNSSTKLFSNLYLYLDQYLNFCF